MPVVPNSRLGKIEFYEARLTPWENHAVAIGLSTAQVAALEVHVQAARAAYNAHLAARDAALAATQEFYNKVRAMHNAPGAGADMIRDIKNHAETTNNPNVYTLAQIPPPATPGKTPPPGTPFEFTVGLLQSGALELKWKCNNPAGTQGTMYEIKRRLGAAGAFEYVGATGIKSFTDETLPAGNSAVTYQITAVRSTVRGNPAQFTVTFGVGGGLFIADTNEETGVKMAA